jgi:hypothetical protein
MVAAEHLQCFTGWTHTTLLCVFDALPDSLKGIGLRGDIEQTLIGFGILDDSFRLSIDRKNQRFLRFLELPHELPGIAAERRHRLNVFFDVKHMTSHCNDSTLKGANKPHCNNFSYHLDAAERGARRKM